MEIVNEMLRAILALPMLVFLIVGSVIRMIKIGIIAGGDFFEEWYLK